MKFQELNAKHLQNKELLDEKIENPNEETKPSYCNVLFNSFLEYCDCSSIIGLKYVGDRKRPVLEKYDLIFFDIHI